MSIPDVLQVEAPSSRPERIVDPEVQANTAGTAQRREGRLCFQYPATEPGSLKTTGVIGTYFAPAKAPAASGWGHSALAELFGDFVVRDGAADHRKFSISIKSLLMGLARVNNTVFRSGETVSPVPTWPSTMVSRRLLRVAKSKNCSIPALFSSVRAM